jgi:soluble lytic murein transglycosylase-like protein
MSGDDQISNKFRFAVPALVAFLLVALIVEAPGAYEASIGVSSSGSPDILLPGASAGQPNGFSSDDSMQELKRTLKRGALVKILATYPNRVPAEGRERLAELLVAEGDKAGIDPLFLAAIVREESGFSTGAVSRRDARGLMQVRPKTGAEIAQRIGLKDFTTDMLHDPAINIRIGVQCLTDHLKAYRGNYSLAVTAYNRGPTAVRHHLKNHGQLSRWYIAYFLRVQKAYREYLRLVAAPERIFLEKM